MKDRRKSLFPQNKVNRFRVALSGFPKSLHFLSLSSRKVNEPFVVDVISVEFQQIFFYEIR